MRLVFHARLASLDQVVWQGPILQTTFLKSRWHGARVARQARLPPPSVATGVWSAHVGELLPLRHPVCAPHVRLGDGHRAVVLGDRARRVDAATMEALQRIRYWGVVVARHAYRATTATAAVCGVWGVAARRMGTVCARRARSCVPRPRRSCAASGCWRCALYLSRHRKRCVPQRHHRARSSVSAARMARPPS